MSRAKEELKVVFGRKPCPSVDPGPGVDKGAACMLKEGHTGGHINPLGLHGQTWAEVSEGVCVQIDTCVGNGEPRCQPCTSVIEGGAA